MSLDIDMNIFLPLGKQVKSKRIAWNYQDFKEISLPVHSENQN